MRRRIEMKKIDDTTKRQVTFSKRCGSLLKKAEEIAVCCDVDVLFVALSPSDRLNKFSNRRTLDMLQRYMELPVEKRLTHMDNVQEKVEKLRQLNHIKGDVSKLHFLDKQVENLELQIKKSTLELQIVEANIRDYEPGPTQEPSLYQLNWCERNLQLSLQKLMARKMELEKQGKMDVVFATQQTVPQQFHINNWIDPYSSSIQGNMYQHWIDKGNSSCNYAYTPSFASSSQSGNIPFAQLQNPSPFIPLPSQQQNMMVDVQQNQAQTFGQSQNVVVDPQQNQAQTFGQSQNVIVDPQQNQAQTFEQSQAQVTFLESGDDSIVDYWKNILASTSTMGPLVTTGTQLNNPSNWNSNLNNNNNINLIIQQNDHSSVQSDTIAPNVNGYNYSMVENTMGNNEFLAETTHENDAWKWADIFLNEPFNEEEFNNLD